MEIPQEVINRLAAIKALAERGATLGEVEAAQSALQRLLLRYNLSIDEVELSEVATHYDLFTNKTNEFAQAFLLSGLAHANYARFVLCRNHTYLLVGSSHIIPVIKEMYSYLWEAVNREASKQAKQHGWKQADRNNFIKAATLEIKHRLKESRKAQEQPLTSDDKALVLKADAKVEAKLRSIFPHLAKTRTSINSNGSAYAGKAYGSSVGLNTQINGSSRRLLT